MKMWVRSLALLCGLRIGVAKSCGVGRRCGLDLASLWLWHRLAAAVLIQPLAWELPYGAGVALKRKKKKEKKRQTDRQKERKVARPEKCLTSTRHLRN